MKKKLQIKIMHKEATDLLHDAGILASTLLTKSSAQSLLNMLAFEILLKACVLIHNGSFKSNHKYHDLYASLPQMARKRIVERTRQVTEITLDDESLQELLKIFECNFKKLRYPYELYKNMTEKEYLEYSKLWVELGAPEEEAEIQLRPVELSGLTDAIKEEVELYLKNN